jgi:hypothetical protein
MPEIKYLLEMFLPTLITIHIQNPVKFSLASQVEMSLMALLFVYLMLLKVAMIVTGSLGKNMTLNGQMVRLNLNRRAKGMCLVAASC